MKKLLFIILFLLNFVNVFAVISVKSERKIEEYKQKAKIVGSASLSALYYLFGAACFAHVCNEIGNIFYDDKGKGRPLFQVIKKFTSNTLVDLGVGCAFFYCANKLSNYCSEKYKELNKEERIQKTELITDEEIEDNKDILFTKAAFTSWIAGSVMVMSFNRIGKVFNRYKESRKLNKSLSRDEKISGLLISLVIPAFGYTLYKTLPYSIESFKKIFK